MPTRRPLLCLPLTRNHRRLRRQRCYQWRAWTTECNDIVFTDESRFCLQHHDGRIRIWKHRGERLLNYCVMHRHTGHAPGIMIELLPWPACFPDPSPIQNECSMLAQRLAQKTPPSATPDQICQYVENAWTAVPQGNVSKASLTLQAVSTENSVIGRVVVYRASSPQVLDSINGLGKVDSAFHPRYIGSINEYRACLGS
ncbi:transposable element Tcb1 transposase [Trichonephila clavipes]|nr:transposable element Tcb1 transposase [Trichonephila clavipes]